MENSVKVGDLFATIYAALGFDKDESGTIWAAPKPAG